MTDGLVVVTPGGGENRALVAFDCETGELAWSTGDDRAAYASPMRTKLAGRDQFLVFNGAGLRSFNHEGEPLWLVPWVTQGEKQRVNVAQPIVVEPFSDSPENTGYVLISSGYSMGTALIKVSWRPRQVERRGGLAKQFLEVKDVELRRARGIHLRF